MLSYVHGRKSAGVRRKCVLCAYISFQQVPNNDVPYTVSCVRRFAVRPVLFDVGVFRVRVSEHTYV